MHPLIHFLGAFARGSNRVAILVAEVALAALMIACTYGVIARYVFNSPSIYITEVCVYLLLVCSWLSIGWVHLENRHVSVEAFHMRFSPRGKRLATCISQLCILFFCLVLLWAGISVVETALARNYRSASMLRFPLWIAYGMIPLGGTLLGLATLRQLFIPNSVESNDSIKEF